MDRQPCVCILASGRCGALHIGVTSDLLSRLYQHREGITKGWAASENAIHLVWYEQHSEMESAIHREKRMKK